jgi:membrane-bound ClpP family serine protease
MARSIYHRTSAMTAGKSSVGTTAAAIVGLVALLILIFAFGTAAWTWILMLVAGAVHFRVSGHTPGFWTCAPVGFLLAVIIGALRQSSK